MLGKAITIVYSGDTNFETSTLEALRLLKRGCCDNRARVSRVCVFPDANYQIIIMTIRKNIMIKISD